VDLPEFCFCGCRTPRSKYDTANLEGVMLIFELSPWINYLNVMTHAETDPAHLQNISAFMADGATVYKLLLAEVHDGKKRNRKERKLAKRWVKFSRNARKDATAKAAELGMPDPMDLPLVGPDDMKAWVFEGTLPPIDA
jgi:hypothetical protein